ncbi:Transmembrane protease serine 11D [Dermatophagoides pteronyssinus]|uniref:Transmembrane protease serine 11D n=1 Tax=Dermatophagoides pteronyssinus TaxID=6956 RepID=A0ABQ8J8R2_DERPT|nr:Transmembrane protease serine 11D [Dermatophagoides pteronyssinus]
MAPYLAILFIGFSFVSSMLSSTMTTTMIINNEINSESSKRIVGGERARIEQIPWQALIQQRISSFENDSSTIIQCGAVIIDPLWILSAGHCIHRPRQGGSYPIDVYFGVTEITPDIRQSNVVRSVIRIFDPAKSDQRLSGDLILLQLNQSITISSKIQPIRLPEMDDNFDYQIGVASGYGATFFQDPKTIKPINILHSVSVPILPKSSCLELYRKAFKDGATIAEDLIQKNKLICAGYRQGGSDACIGDSGGPLAVCVDDFWSSWRRRRRSNSMTRSSSSSNYLDKQCNGQWKLAGIISIGYRCAEPQLPGLYIDLTVYSKWIQSIIMNNRLIDLKIN